MKTYFQFILLLSPVIVLAQEVSYNEAEIAAMNYYKYKCKSNTDIAIKDTCIGEYNDHNSWYAFNFEPEGYVIIAGNKSAGPVLGYSNIGSISMKNPSPEWLFLMSEYEIYIDSLFNNKTENRDKWTRWNMLLSYLPGLKSHIFSGQDTMLLTSRWGQGPPNILNGFPDCDAYNFFIEVSNTDCNDCGNDKCPTGCVATAMGQVLYYWQFAKGADAFYDWWNMRDSLNHILANNDYQIERDAIAYLLRRCGVNVGMNYCNNNNCISSADDSDIKDVLIDLGYDDNMDFKRRIYYLHTTWKEMLREELSNGRPVIYGGYRHDGGLNYPGHSFVCDGYGWDLFADHLFHFNFGWRGLAGITGNADGFYSIDDNYPILQTALFGIKPDYSTTQSLQNITILENNQIVYQVSSNINVAGSGTTFIVDGNGTTGGRCRMLAPNSIRLMTGFRAERGSSFRAKAFEPRLLTFAKSSEIQNQTESVNSEVDESVFVYPNPVTKYLNIKALNNFSIKEIYIFNVDGVLTFSEKFTNNSSVEINTENFLSGLYFVRIITDENVYFKKIIKI